MNHRPLLEVSVRVPVEVEDRVADVFQQVFRQPAALATDEDTLITAVSIYCTRSAEWTARRRSQLEAGLRRLRTSGVGVGRARLRVRTLRAQDWATSWKRHFRPFEIGRALLVRPSWSRRRARPGQAEVILDPGLSFGTGQHPTTAFCLEQIVRHRPRGRPRSLLDLGTGSGILAIAARKLGYAPVEAFDHDPAAVRAARDNLTRNLEAGGVRLVQRDLSRLPLRPPATFDVVCANLLADLLVRERDRIVARVRRGGVLVLAGILTREYPTVRRRYVEAGLTQIGSRRVREWQSGAFRTPN